MDYEPKLAWWVGADRLTLQVEAKSRVERTENASVGRGAQFRSLAQHTEYSKRGGRATRNRGAKWASLNKS